MHKGIPTATVLALVLSAASADVRGASPTWAYASIHGLRMYDEAPEPGEASGSAAYAPVPPRGGLGAIDLVGPDLRALSAGREVIADDIVASVTHLGIVQADVTPFLDLPAAETRARSQQRAGQ